MCLRVSEAITGQWNVLQASDFYIQEWTKMKRWPRIWHWHYSHLDNQFSRPSQWDQPGFYYFEKSQKWYSFSFSLKMMIWRYNLPLYFSCNGTFFFFFAEVCGNFQANSPTPWVESILWDVQNYNNERNGAEWISAEPNCMHKLAV